MKNFVQPGDALELDATAGVTGGVGYVFGTATDKVLAIASATVAAASGAIGTFNTEGVYELPKETGVDYVEGEPVFWDDTAKEIQKSATGHWPCGTSIETTVSGAATIKVKLSGQAETIVP